MSEDSNPAQGAETTATSPVAADGVTHFRLHFTRAAPPAPWQVAALCRWRDRLRALGLVGQAEARYGGVGFGNLSARHPHRRDAFLITGTQTGARARLGPHDFAIVTAIDLGTNCVFAHGGSAPSSEAMTHAQCYAADPQVGVVFHGHSPLLWAGAAQLGILSTPADIGYGTPEMAAAVAGLLALAGPQAAMPPALADLRKPARLFRMGGHEDGIIAVAATADAAGEALLRALVALGDATAEALLAGEPARG